MINQIGVHIKVKNFTKSKQFYENLGFKKVFEYGPNKKVKENYNGIVFEHGGCKLEIADGHIAVKPDVFKHKIKDSKISLMVYVDSVYKIMQRCKKHNIELAVEPRHYYWGTIEIVVKDPDGTVLVFICEYSKKEAKNTNVNESSAAK